MPNSFGRITEGKGVGLETEEKGCEHDHTIFSVGIVSYAIADAKIADANECRYALDGLVCSDCKTTFTRRKEEGGFQSSLRTPVYACEGLKSCNCECVYCSTCFSKHLKELMTREEGRVRGRH